MNLWDVFVFAFNAIMPIILLIVVGYILKRIGFLKEEFLKMGNKFVFNVCLPCLLFINVYSIGSFSEIDWSVVIYSEIIIIVFFLIGMLFVKLFVKDPKQKGVILQCVFRSNYAIIGISLAQSLGGDAGLKIAAILSAFSIPTFNILAVLALSMYNDGKADFKNVLINIAKNPLIIGVVVGLVFLGIRALIPYEDIIDPITLEVTRNYKFTLKDNLPFLYKSVENISKIASPFALIVLGGLFNFSTVKGMIKEIIYGTSARILVVPAVGIFAAVLLSKYTSLINFDKTVYPALIALFGSPVAVSSAIMAQNMDNDGELAGQLVVWTSLFSIITIFVFVVILRSIGLL